MNKIVEQVFKIDEDKNLSKLVKKAFGIYWHDEYCEEFAHIVFIDTKPRHVIRCYITPHLENNTFKPDFNDYLGRIDHTDFYKLLLLVTTYPEYHRIHKPAYKCLTKKNEPLDKFLKETNGWLVYNYQTVILYEMSTEASPEQATVFRKKINKKLVPAFEESKKIKVFGTTLHDIIDTRMTAGYTFNPNYQGTYKLYQYLNG